MKSLNQTPAAKTDKATARPTNAQIEAGQIVNARGQIEQVYVTSHCPSCGKFNGESHPSRSVQCECGHDYITPTALEHLQTWVGGICCDYRADHWETIMLGNLVREHAALVACVELYKPMMSHHKPDCVCMHCKALANLAAVRGESEGAQSPAASS
jgi:hypothetical protein